MSNEDITAEKLYRILKHNPLSIDETVIATLDLIQEECINRNLKGITTWCMISAYELGRIIERHEQRAKRK